MNKKQTPRLVLIIVLLILAGLSIYPPDQKLKQGIDLGGGVELIYAIDTVDLEDDQIQGLSEKMITVLQRRIDPANIQNLVWRPQGSNRFAIQMPLASAEARAKRDIYTEAEQKLMDKNVNRTRVIQSLSKPEAERAELFKSFAQGDPNRTEMLNELANIYDNRKELQDAREKLDTDIKNAENDITSAGMELDSVKAKILEWKVLDTNALDEALSEFTDVNDNIPVLNNYIQVHSQWAQTADDLIELTPKYTEAINAIDSLNLTEAQLNLCLELSPNSSTRKIKIKQLKKDFPDRVSLVDEVIAAYDGYREYRGRLDDPKDLQRMLKGAGILEFRVLATPNTRFIENVDALRTYIDRLEEKGPDYASVKGEYIWCEIENIDEWKAADRDEYPTIIGEFGNKYYVLASDKKDEVILKLQGSDDDWKLEKAYPTTDSSGRRAIGLLFDIKGGKKFANVTSKNVDRPLCILLDNLAISAPNIQEKVSRQGTITGSFSQVQVEDMVNKLNAGSLPGRLIEQPISVNTIGPSIGADNRDQGIKAGIIGLIVVIACMALYYCKAGSIADVALLMNMLFVLATMAGIRATFTLPGIAGLILTIGMSVDANVLIFERIREEQEKGCSLRIAIKNGYEKAFRTIFDANLTTFITAAILYWRASEEVKGFAIVLMLGILSSMFTALFATRVIFDLLLNKRVIKDHLMMLRLIHKPNINWMKSRTVFFCISSVLIISGLVVFFSRNDIENSKYDIEFTGGTSVQIIFKEGINYTQQEVQDKIRELLPAASVYSVGETGDQFEITTTQTNKIIVSVPVNKAAGLTDEQITRKIQSTKRNIAGKLNNLVLTRDSDNVTITTSQMNQSLVKDVLSKVFPDAEIEPDVDEFVNNAILDTFEGELEIQEDLRPTIVSEEEITPELVDTNPELADYLGGIKIVCDIERAATLAEIRSRISDLQFKPDTRDLETYDYQILDKNLNNIDEQDQPINSFIYMSADPEAGIRELSSDEWDRFAENERLKVKSATEFATSLPRVRQFDPSIGAEQKTRTMIAIVLSLFSIVTYIWIRFGNVRYGIAAIVALVHDVCITLGAVTACAYIAGTSIGDLLLIGDFKINLAIIAAFLTLIGYSLNDTIVVFDRIRENRGKARTLNPQTITDSINQTISRTILTSFTTFIVVLIMYIFGGAGLRGFSFAIGFGVIVGTYSSIAIAAPILLIGTKANKEKKDQNEK